MTPETAELLLTAAIEARRRARIATAKGKEALAQRWSAAAAQLATMLKGEHT